MRGRTPRKGVLLDFPFPSAIWACRIWSRNALWKLVDLLNSSADSTLPHEEQKQQKEKTIGKERMTLRRFPGFRGSERPAVADIHILCHVFQDIPWSPSVEMHLRHRNFGLTIHQVILILDKLKDNLTHTLNFFIWADQQRGHYHTVESFKILKGTMHVHLDHLHPLLKDMEAKGRFVSIIVLILVMEVFVEKNMVQPALEVFQSITKFGSRPDEDAYNLILQVLLDAGPIDVAIEVFEQFKQDRWCSPGNTTYSLVLWGLGKAGKVVEARKLLENFKSSSQMLPVEAHNQLVSGLCEGGWMDYAEEFVIEMYELGFEPSAYVYTGLVSANAKAGRLTEAYRYYIDAVKDKLIAPSVELSTMLIEGFCKQKDAESAQKLLLQMVNVGLSPDANMYAAVVECASKQGQWEVGTEPSNASKKQEVNTNAKLCGSLIISCADAGHMETALSLLCRMVAEGHVCFEETTFSTLISRLVELNQPNYWQKIFMAIEGLEEKLQTTLLRMLVGILNNADKDVSKHVMGLMIERGLSPP